MALNFSPTVLEQTRSSGDSGKSTAGSLLPLIVAGATVAATGGFGAPAVAGVGAGSGLGAAGAAGGATAGTTAAASEAALFNTALAGSAEGIVTPAALTAAGGTALPAIGTGVASAPTGFFGTGIGAKELTRGLNTAQFINNLNQRNLQGAATNAIGFGSSFRPTVIK